MLRHSDDDLDVDIEQLGYQEIEVLNPMESVLRFQNTFFVLLKLTHIMNLLAQDVQYQNV